MKKLIWVFIFTLSFTAIQAQDYFVSFEAAGASSTVSTVKVDNLTKGTTLTLNGNDILHLTGVVGLPEMESKTGIYLNVFPNPMKSICTIDFTKVTLGYTFIGLYDVSGKLVLETQELLHKGRYSYILSGIGSGIYVLKIRSDKYSVTSKIVCTAETAGIAGLKHSAANSVSDAPNTASQQQVSSGLKSSQSTIEMAYSEGDVVLMKGISEENSTVVSFTPGMSAVIFDFIPCVDGDGNSYPLVKIAGQIWMAENMKTTRYVNGTTIPLVRDSLAWPFITSPAYCWYNNDSITYGKQYGALYNWYTVNTHDLCPKFWHVPSDDEWTTLYDAIGGYYESGKIKETGDKHWNNQNQFSTNQTGFTALPSGNRDSGNINIGGEWKIVATYQGVRDFFDCWSAPAYDANQAWMRRLTVNFMYDYNVYQMKSRGNAVRCIKD